jgi:DNA-binding NtrC family response regulator
VRRSVLVVDDDASIRQTFELQLGRLGFVVYTAASAEEALGRMSEVAPQVILSDIRMPGLGGLELLSHVHHACPGVPVVMMTAHQDMTSAIAAMKAGAYDYLVKPLDLDRVELLLDRCFRELAQRGRAQRAQGDAAEEPDDDSSGALVGRDPRMIEIYKLIGSLAETRTPVLLRGETGTGKEVIARAIHSNSAAAAEPFVAVNCTSLPETLLESELFGHVRGAFTGATSDRKGRFELAGRGTIFLDEIGDTSPAFQAKLLRVLQERELHPVGSERLRRTEARVVAATHRPLERMVHEGRFREDLYFRLRVVEIVVPPLRERRDDIAPLAEHLLAKAAREMHRARVVLTPDALRALRAYEWPGNVRELEHTLTRALVLARGGIISADLLAFGVVAPASSASGTVSSARDRSADADQSMAAAERAHLARVLAHCAGNKRQAARVLRVSRSRLDRLLEKHGLPAPERGQDGVQTGPAETTPRE